MACGLMASGRRALWTTVAMIGGGTGLLADTIVYSNNPAPGDAFTSNMVAPNGDGQAVGTSHWYYSDVRKDGTIGINTEFAKDGNGSVRFESISGAGKADITYTTGQALGTLADLTSLAYDWYRDGSSDNSSLQAPALRILLADNTSLVWEPVYNDHPGGAPINMWVTSDAISNNSGVFWLNSNQDDRRTFSTWLDTLGGMNVIGINSGVGSGWNGYFLGAVDNITFGFNGPATTYNFEVVPEPSSVVMGLIAGGLGLAATARRRSK